MWRIIAQVLLCSIVSIYAQSVLFDDVNMTHPVDDWEHFVTDSLRSHGIRLYYLSEYGWDILSDVKMLWIQGPYTFYPDSIKEKIVAFCREGGKLFIGIDVMGEVYTTYAEILEDLFNFDNFWGNVKLYLKPYIASQSGEPATYLPFSPFTDGVDSLWLAVAWIIDITGDNVVPFVFLKTGKIIGVVSFPFKHEGDCESYIVIFTGMHTFESHAIYTGEQHPTPDDWKLLINIFTAMSEGYDLGIPCDSIPFMGLPESLRYKYYRCHPLPSPFTPNGDGINDFCQFSFPDMMFSPAVIRIYDIHSVLVKNIQVPLGWAAKSAARWYGKDNSGKPVPQGVYLYEIEQNGEVICTGTVTVAR